jgi:hypothetical protein
MGLDEERAEILMRTVGMLEAQPDVAKVWTNLADE